MTLLGHRQKKIKKKSIMPGPLIAAGIGALGTAINAGATIGANRSSQKFSRDMYNVQRQHALDDWQRNNDYNSPIEQMRRLKEAGLNPHGRATTPGIAGQVRSSDIKNPQFNAPDLGGPLTYLPQMFDFEVKQAQADNLKKQNTTEVQKQLLMAAQTRKASTDADIAHATKAIAIQGAEADLNKTKADTRFQLDENERRAVMQGHNIQEKLQNVINLRLRNAKIPEEIKNLKAMRAELQSSTALKRLEHGLQKSGIYKHDGLLARWIARILDSEGGIMELKKKLESGAMNSILNP